MFREHELSTRCVMSPVPVQAWVWPVTWHIYEWHVCEGLLTCSVRLQGALLGRSFFSFHKMGDAVSVTPFYSALPIRSTI